MTVQALVVWSEPDAAGAEFAERRLDHIDVPYMFVDTA